MPSNISFEFQDCATTTTLFPRQNTKTEARLRWKGRARGKERGNERWGKCRRLYACVLKEGCVNEEELSKKKRLGCMLLNGLLRSICMLIEGNTPCIVGLVTHDLQSASYFRWTNGENQKIILCLSGWPYHTAGCSPIFIWLCLMELDFGMCSEHHVALQNVRVFWINNFTPLICQWQQS